MNAGGVDLFCDCLISPPLVDLHTVTAEFAVITGTDFLISPPLVDLHTVTAGFAVNTGDPYP